MRDRLLLTLLLLLPACGAPEPKRTDHTPELDGPAEPSFEADGRTFLERHCTPCHGAADPEAGLSLTRYTRTDGEPAVIADFRTFDEVVAYVRDGSMPPESEPRPDAKAKARFLDWLDRVLATADRTEPPDPGRVTMRRLNRNEYRNTVRDLLGIDYEAVSDFPDDDVGYGFDNVGDVLTLPPLLLERYLAAAEDIADRVLQIEDPDDPPVRHYPGAELATTARGGTTGSGGRVCSTNGSVIATTRVPRDGEYVLRVTTWAQQAGPEPARIRLFRMGKPLTTHDVTGTRDAPQTFEARFTLKRGIARVGGAFVNDYWDPKHADPAQRDRNLIIESVELAGPIDARPGPPPELRRRLLAPGAVASSADTRNAGTRSAESGRRAVLSALCGRAFRRPPTDAEMDRLAGLWQLVEDAEGSADRGLHAALQAVLVSPHFLFRVESHPHPDDAGWVRDLDDFALASRLSYFLWSSMPDDRLLDVAAAGRLHADLGVEARRMLDDPRADALVRNFGSQWLETRQLAVATPDAERFPDFDDALATSMRTETELLLRAVLREDRSAREIISADWTYIDGRLARHYGRADVAGDEFVRVQQTDTGRAGVLGHASVLTVSSYPTRTSPVKRGKWLLEQIVGAPTPPPPPGVGDLPESGDDVAGLTFRERMERHRTDPSCSVCHVRMDPLGLALENFDAIGRWRTHDGDLPIDPSGTLPDGRTIDGPSELRAALLEDDAFVRNLTAKLLTYALGRGPIPSDDDVVSEIVARAGPDGHRLRDLVLGVVTSVPFRRHRGESAATEENDAAGRQPGAEEMQK